MNRRSHAHPKRGVHSRQERLRPNGNTASVSTTGRAKTTRRWFRFRRNEVRNLAVSSLATPSQNQLQWRRVFTIVALLYFALCAAVVWIVVQAGIYGWQSGTWDRLFSALLLPITPMVLFIYFSLAWLNNSARVEQQLQPFRAALEEHANEIPAISPPIQPLSADELEDAPISFTALHPFTGLPDAANPILYLLVGAFFAFMSGFAALYNALGLSGGIVIFLVGGVIVFGLLLLAFSIFCWIYFSRGPFWPLRITADANGLTWISGRRQIQQTVSWQSVRAFYRFARSSSNQVTPDDLIFVLYLDNTVLAWKVKQWGNDQNTLNETSRLAQIIVTRTGQPLRDAMTPFAALDYALGTSNGQNIPISLRPGLTAYLKLWQRYSRATIALPLISFVVVILLIVLSPYGTAFLRDRQTAYFVGLAPQVQAAPLLYHNQLSTNDGLWPVASGSQGQLAFVNGMYQMSGQKGQPVVALIPPTYTDAALEVTVHQQGPAAATAEQNGQYDQDMGAGLAFHARNSSDMIVFTVDMQNDTWYLEYYRATHEGASSQDALESLSPTYQNGPFQFEEQALGPTNAIHLGENASNTLLVVMRAPIYLLYINGQYVGQFTERFDEYKPPTTGQVGLFLADGSSPATFSDFRVYAVRPQSSLNYV